MRESDNISKENYLPIFLNKLVQDMRLRNYSKDTEKAYYHHLKYFLNFLDKRPEEVGWEEVREYLIYLNEEKQVSKSSFKQAIAALRFMFEYSLGKEWIKNRIVYPKSSKYVPSILNKRELNKLFSCVKELKYKTVLYCCYGSGLRLSEALNLKVSDIESNEMRLRIRSSKGGHERYAMLSPQLLELLRDYWKEEKPSDWLFPGRQKCNHVNSAVIQKACSKAGRFAGIKKRVFPHMLRHSFATHLLEQGTDIRLIQELMGHTCINSTMVYLHLTTKRFRKVSSPIDQLDLS